MHEYKSQHLSQKPSLVFRRRGPSSLSWFHQKTALGGRTVWFGSIFPSWISCWTISTESRPHQNNVKPYNIGVQTWVLTLHWPAQPPPLTRPHVSAMTWLLFKLLFLLPAILKFSTPPLSDQAYTSAQAPVLCSLLLLTVGSQLSPLIHPFSLNWMTSFLPLSSSIPLSS